MRPASSCDTPHWPRDSVLFTSNLPSPQPHVRVGLRRIHPVVHRPEQPVRVVLDVGVATAVRVGDQFPAVHLEITVRVAHQPEVRRLPDQHAVIENLQRTSQHQAIGEHRALVHLAVGVRVLEDDDPAERLELSGTR